MVRKSLKDYGDKLDPAEKDSIENAIKDLEAATRDGDKETIEKKTEALMSASQKLGEKIYQQQAAQQAEAGNANANGDNNGNGGGNNNKDDNVVDAEFTEVKK